MDDITHISATEAKQSFGALIDSAQHAPVIIEKQKREIAAIISMADYERLTRLNLEEFQEFRKKTAQKAKERGLTESLLNDMLKDEN
ncbi:MAG: type II toxin-antitoxin system Phd/YefM family antitoxin [Rickettsiales bacterium]|nr:type II toxin-antitoxin system Phd/YefM family antitoxin [Pseudomonadota bacterium]MDA0965619.1 type II toxin-antitoxin system Phd/YefM family antitoxin [Pseudomonadota bacterium]MDG4542943.1 type II toxin-antitoxin system Phd/YefM family antitoxin [Rickettsiales bacterium]MDG4544609.1 type II toxin-antitoxin system Phd/YefM family antitoxin [Rickettsiales bacterium]MDG4546731.1 type II toxin-antitoxin system Phd/YefM family antitoxin [Rickettsiales bacterium]